MIPTLYPRRVYAIEPILHSAGSSTLTLDLVSSPSLKSSVSNHSDSSNDWSEMIGEDLTIHIPLPDIKLEKLVCWACHYHPYWSFSDVRVGFRCILPSNLAWRPRYCQSKPFFLFCSFLFPLLLLISVKGAAWTNTDDGKRSVNV